MSCGVVRAVLCSRCRRTFAPYEVEDRYNRFCRSSPPGAQKKEDRSTTLLQEQSSGGFFQVGWPFGLAFSLVVLFTETFQLAVSS